MMCAQKVRRLLRDRQAGILGLSSRAVICEVSADYSKFLQILEEDIHPSSTSRSDIIQGLPQQALP